MLTQSWSGLPAQRGKPSDGQKCREVLISLSTSHLGRSHWDRLEVPTGLFILLLSPSSVRASGIFSQIGVLLSNLTYYTYFDSAAFGIRKDHALNKRAHGDATRI